MTNNEFLNFDMNDYLGDTASANVVSSDLKVQTLPHSVHLSLLKSAKNAYRMFFHITNTGVVKQGCMFEMILPFPESENNATRKVFLASMVHSTEGLEDFSRNNPWRDANFSNLQRVYTKGMPFNSVAVSGKLTQQLVIADDTQWDNEKDNKFFFAVYDALKKINAMTGIMVKDKMVLAKTEKDKQVLAQLKIDQTKIAIARWKEYEAKLVERGSLIMSDIIFAEANGVVPTFQIHQQTNMPQPGLSHADLFQNAKAPMTFAPALNIFTGYARANAKQTEDIHTLNQEGSRFPAVPLGISTLGEGRTRAQVAAVCYDRIRGQVPVRLSMIDTFSRDENSNRTSRADTMISVLGNNPQVQVHGKIRALSAKHGTLASIFVIEVDDYIVIGSNTDIDSGIAFDEANDGIGCVDEDFATEVNIVPEQEAPEAQSEEVVMDLSDPLDF